MLELGLVCGITATVPSALAAPLPKVARVAQTPAAASTQAPAPTTQAPAAPNQGLVVLPTYGAVSVPVASPADPVTSQQVVYQAGSAGAGVATSSPRVYLVFWGTQWGTASTDAAGRTTFSGDPAGVAPVLQGFFAGLGTAGEDWSGVVTQYCKGVAPGAQTCPPYAAHVAYPTGGVLSGTWEDSSAGAPANATAHALAAEAIDAAVHFGSTTPASNDGAQYLIVSPTGVTPDGFQQAGFCAWHDDTADSNLDGGGAVAADFAVAFANIPYVPDAGNTCGKNFVNSGATGLLDGVSIVAGSEYADMLTNGVPSSGWLDRTAKGVADKCAWIPHEVIQGGARNLSLATGAFAVPSLFSDDFAPGNGVCEVSHPTVADDTAPTPAAVTSSAAVSFLRGIDRSFTVTTTGFPAPVITESGTLPPGVVFSDTHFGSATLSGTATGPWAIYPVTVTAVNNAGNPSTQQLTLTVLPDAGGIITVAGFPDLAGHGGNHGPATSAQLFHPTAVAIDGPGNLYIADSRNNEIRKLAPDGVITILAGSPLGYARSSGDGGPATSAFLNDPSGVTVDSAGAVYIADRFNNRIRKVVPDGTITNFVGDPGGTAGNTGDGGPAGGARLNQPSGVTIDSSGNLYIVDAGNNRIRKVNAAGIVSNFAGSPAAIAGNTGDGGPATAATLNQPWGFALDAAGNAFIADPTNDRIRKVAANGVITNFAGSPAGPGPATWGDAGDGGAATAATLNLTLGHPSVAVDRQGNVYIADVNNRRIRMVDRTGIISDYAGVVLGNQGTGGDNGPALSATFFDPSGLAFNAAGDLLVADEYGSVIRQVFLPGPSITSAATGAFTVGVTTSVTVAATGYPSPGLSESGRLPAGVTFNASTATISGTPAQGGVGSYPLTITAANGVVPDGTQSFTLTVDQARFTYPVDGQTSVDTALPVTWSTIPQAQGYIVVLGTTHFGTNLANSGILAPTSNRYLIPSALPAGSDLHATLLAEVGGTWTSYQAITFRAAATGHATFTNPLNGQTNVNVSHPFTWTTIVGAQGYILVVGTTRYGTDLLNSGVLPSSQTSYSMSTLPKGKVLYATLLTKVNGSFSRYELVAFIVKA